MTHKLVAEILEANSSEAFAIVVKTHQAVSETLDFDNLQLTGLLPFLLIRTDVKLTTVD